MMIYTYACYQFIMFDAYHFIVLLGMQMELQPIQNMHISLSFGV